MKTPYKKSTWFAVCLAALFSTSVLAFSAGELDSSFNPGSGANGSVNALALQADGKIIIGGNFTSVNGETRNRIARLDANGSLDSSFNPGSGANGSVNALALQADGKIIIGGDFEVVNGAARRGIARLNVDGSLDNSFDPGDGVYSSYGSGLYALAVQADGKIIMGGDFTEVNGTERNGVARLNANGSFDSNFNLDSGVGGGVDSLVMQADGQIIIGGSFGIDGATTVVARLNADGSLDSSFTPVEDFDGRALALALQTDGKIIIGGFFESFNYIARLNADGSLDNSFNPGSGTDSVVETLAVQADGKIVLGGRFTSFNGAVSNGITRLNADGSFDNSFDPGNGIDASPEDAAVNALAVQADGKIILGGYFRSFNTVARKHIVRIHSGDSDADSIEDAADAFPFDATESIDTDHDGIGNNTDTDDDNDGVVDASDNCPLKSNASQGDIDNDGIGDACDMDNDNDGVPDGSDAFPLNNAAAADTDGDGFPNDWNASCDITCQNNSDLVLDNCPTTASLNLLNNDGDSLGNICDADDDNDGVEDLMDSFPFDPTRSAAQSNFLYTFNGDAANDNFGLSVSGAGDVNADGYPDMLVGAPGDDNNGSNSGSARVLSGVDGAVLYTFNGDSADDEFGLSVSGAGDVNADGYADVIVGARGDDNNGSNSGSARILSGVDGAVLYTFNGDSANDDFGRSVSGAGDVNADGYADVIVGAPQDDNNGTNSGSARVLSGADGSILYVFNGDSAYDLFGISVSGAGDVNNDGYADVLVGVYGDNDYSGSVRVLSGVDGAVLYTFNGDSAGDGFGAAVSGAGDVNNDGYADVIVGATLDDNNDEDSGSARVLSGQDGTILYTFNGDGFRDYFGSSVSGAGDVNADGYADVIVGASDDDNNGYNTGSARVFSGKDGTILYTFNGDSSSGNFGRSVSSAGDMNNDGYADMLVGARGDYNNNGSSGAVVVLNGKGLWTDTDGDGANDAVDSDDDNDGVPDILDWFPVNPLLAGDEDDDGIEGAVDNCPTIANVSQLNTDGDTQGNICDSDDDNDGVADTVDSYPLDPTRSAGSTNILNTFNGDSATDIFGVSVSGAGDVDADGYPDVIVGAPQDDNNGRSNSGSARVLSGRNGAILYTFNGDSANDYFGSSVSGAGDVNADGYADVIVGAYQDDNNGRSNSGSARVLSGQNGAILYTFNGDSANDLFGTSVSGAGDVNADGYADVIVGAPDDDNNGGASGSARVFSGKDGTILYTFNGDSFNDYFGSSVSGAGDVNNDGYADVIVGAYYDDNNGADSGSARVLSGQNGAILYTFNGDSANDLFGISVSGAGDVNADGYADVIVGAFQDDNDEYNSGSARVLSGQDGAILYTFYGDSTDDVFGLVSDAGDVNNDGYADVIVGAREDDNGGINSGSARVFSGVDGSVLYTFNGDTADDGFGGSVSAAGDVNNDGYADVIVGAYQDDNNGMNSGSVRLFSGKGLWTDADGDGLNDAVDSDDDNDSVLDINDATLHGDGIDADGDGTMDSFDADDDNDLMPDTWELSYGFNPLVNDANSDADGDGYTNLQEYRNGSNPTVFNAKVKSDYNADGIAGWILKGVSNGNETASQNWQLTFPLFSQNWAVPNRFYHPNFPDQSNWELVTSGDFNHDGDADILWRHNTTSQWKVWHIQNGVRVAQTNLVDYGFGHEWQVLGAGDTDKDGDDDILLNNTSTGDIIVWVMQDHTIADIQYIGVNTAYTLNRIGDFDKDGDVDLLFRQNGGDALITWELETNAFVQERVLANTGTDYNPVCSGDFDNDGDDDIMLLNSVTHQEKWFVMENYTRTQKFGGDNTGFSFLGCGDYDGDGDADTLWKRDSDYMTRVVLQQNYGVIKQTVYTNAFGQNGFVYRGNSN